MKEIVEKLITPVKKTRVINSEQFIVIDRKTGEEIKGDHLVISNSTNKKSINSKEYGIIDLQRLQSVCQMNLSLNSYGLILVLSQYLSFNTSSIVDKDGRPLTTKAIAGLVDKSINSTKQYLNELERNGIIVYTHDPKTKRKSYFLNPYLLRRGKNFESKHLALFSDLEPPLESKESTEFQKNIDAFEIQKAPHVSY